MTSSLKTIIMLLLNIIEIVRWHIRTTADCPITRESLITAYYCIPAALNCIIVYFFFQKGYEAVELKHNETNYRLVLSDGTHMNSYFYLCIQLNDLIVKKKVKYGTLLRIDEHKFIDGENCTNHSPRLKIKINLSKVDIYLVLVNFTYFLDGLYSFKK